MISSHQSKWGDQRRWRMTSSHQSKWGGARGIASSRVSANLKAATLVAACQRTKGSCDQGVQDLYSAQQLTNRRAKRPRAGAGWETCRRTESTISRLRARTHIACTDCAVATCQRMVFCSESASLVYISPGRASRLHVTISSTNGCTCSRMDTA